MDIHQNTHRGKIEKDLVFANSLKYDLLANGQVFMND